MRKLNKNARAGIRGGKNPFFFPDNDCLPKFNYSNGAGWRSKNKGHLKSERPPYSGAEGIKSKRRGRWGR
jgi:hypothetical protein